MKNASVWGFLWDFLFMTVMLKAIAAAWVAQRLKKLWTQWFGATPRNTAIWEHYTRRAEGRGHQGDNVLTCGQEKCQVFV